jgi:membrane-bound serine protease (ClpP class)
MHVSLAALRRALVLVVLALVTLGLTASLAWARPDAALVAQDAGDAGDAEGVADAADDGAAADAADTPVIEILPISGFLDPPVAAQLRDVLEQAEREGSDLVVVQLDSNGGVSVDVDELLTMIETSSVPVAVLVGPLGTAPDAAGAAGLLWLAADVRVVSSDAAVGPISPVDLSDRDGTFPADTRVAAYVEAAGGDLELAQRLLTEPVDAQTLADAGVASFVAQGLEPLLLELDGTTLTVNGEARELRIRGDEVGVRFHSLGLVRRLLHAATTAPFIYLLLTVGLGMLLFEVFQPGFGVAGLAGLITLAIGVFGLTVLPVVWWAVALVVLGLILYAVDTAIAGFGPVTLAATVAFVVGSAGFYAADALTLSWWLIGATTVTAFGFFVFVMTSILRAQAGPEGVAVDDLVGKPGIVRSVLNPEGHVYIDGALWRARWTGDTRRAKVGTPVRVHAVDGPVLLVEAFTPEPVAAGGARDDADA